MAVIFFREFAAAEAAVGNSTGAADLLQVKQALNRHALSRAFY